MLMIQALFWVSVCCVMYAYLGYPLLLQLLSWGRLNRRALLDQTSWCPTVSMIIPVHNEEKRIIAKVDNTKALRYPAGSLQVIFVSDGSTDRTAELIRSHAGDAMELIELSDRGGKAAALNAGIARARHDLIVFSDAAIALEPAALETIVRPFVDPTIGCVSGEDHIGESGGESWYGRYELAIRRLESNLHSIVGASGSFYAQRRRLCGPFQEGMAPDFLSVLRTVAAGYRAVTEPGAVGIMTSVKDVRQEFERKVRTLIRGMTTLFAHAGMLNPWRYGTFAFELLSHKVLRWSVPFFLAGAWASSAALLSTPWFLFCFVAQTAFYGAALLAFWGWAGLRASLFGKVTLYFSMVNAAIVVAWFRYGSGVRQELWTPSQR